MQGRLLTGATESCEEAAAGTGRRDGGSQPPAGQYSNISASMMDGFLFLKAAALSSTQSSGNWRRSGRSAERYEDCCTSLDRSPRGAYVNEPNAVLRQGGEHVIIPCHRVHHVVKSELPFS